jgi:hypothetical protein
VDVIVRARNKNERQYAEKKDLNMVNAQDRELRIELSENE